MARANLGNLLSVATEQPAAPAPEVSPAANPAAEPTKAARKAAVPAPARKAVSRGPKTVQTGTHWTEYERLEARLRDEQVEQLDTLVRRLNKRRGGVGERITKNSLLRIAVGLLLERQDSLAGNTEDEIRASLHA